MKKKKANSRQQSKLLQMTNDSTEKNKFVASFVTVH